ncbi:MAG: response regulator transcription factor [Actinobacteria bacterium]|nr:response regulator transcription factor [Actinomycetota bacterium]MBU1943218.1 response regulator transcription factor [Actinomycetota bacterium]MBU2686223.1 response regulator transcription factor [Actinomycetota bacterium]
MRILVIEDDRKIARAVKKGLEQESFAVDIALDFDEGLGLAVTQEYDLLIIDRMLPGSRDGMDVCREVRSRDMAVPVLFLTARDKVADRVQGLNVGGDDYLVKPFAFEELLARIRALLRRPRGTVGETLRVADLTLDTGTFEAARAGSRIPLSRTEYALLEYLMRNQDIVLSRESIIAHVWDYDADVLPNTVEVYIGYLRGKVDKPFEGPALIHTVRGFGYKIGEKE